MIITLVRGEMVMAIPQERSNFTYADYLKLGDDARYEVIDGQIYNMSPSPIPKHQRVLGELFTEFSVYLRGKECRVFIAPIDVCLSEEKEDLSKVKEWVIPDMVVVCDKDKIGEKRIMGSPDLLVEVLSTSTAKHDRLTKYNKYQQAGVKEYWIVDPVHETIEIFSLQDGRYIPFNIYAKEDSIKVSIFEDLCIHLNNIFVD